ncbi:beta strand repeat-containing protein [Rhodoferax sp.]|uniref:beta strand repeat-containing protein n=1 Tax=Rhodoferax sp. TaxID=50421 RepID=UPI00374DAC48
MRYLKFCVLAVLLAFVAACGGGGNPGSTSTVVGTITTVSSITLLASASSLDSSDSSTGVTITAVVKNSSNIGIASQSVAFSASSGLLQAAATATDTNGKATATLNTGGDSSNRVVTVTVISGGVSKSILLPVSGTTLTISGSASVLSGAVSTFSVKVADSGGAAVSGAALTVVSALNNPVSLTSASTNSSGTDTFTYTATNAGSDTLTVTGAGVSTQYAVSISNTDFSFTTPADGTDIAIGSSQAVTVRLLPVVAGTTISFSSTRGSVGTSSTTTDSSGFASTTVSSTTAGSANITAQVLSGTQSGAQTRRAVNFVATVPATVVLQTSASAVAPNAAGSTTNSVTLTATVRDANGNAVKNQIVNFSIVSDTSGGSIGTGSGTTNANGIVTDTFIPGSSSTAANGVVLKAALASNASLSGTTSMTVSARALFISIATGNTISNLDQNTYSKPFSVYVNDANGAAVTNQAIVLSAYPTTYRKGTLSYISSVWSYTGATYTSCVNEDVNRDGNLGTKVVSGVTVTEDTNGDGHLTPGLPGVVSPSSITTDSTGLATFNLNYGEQYAPWLVFEIKATASVFGTESSAVYTYTAAGEAGDFTSSTPPSGRTSPFGSSTSCTDAL